MHAVGAGAIAAVAAASLFAAPRAGGGVDCFARHPAVHTGNGRAKGSHRERKVATQLLWMRVLSNCRTRTGPRAVLNTATFEMEPRMLAQRIEVGTGWTVGAYSAGTTVADCKIP